MIRYIKIEDSKKRDAEITFKSINSKASVYLAMETREKPKNKKVIKSSKDKSLKALIGNANPSQEDYNKFSEIVKSSEMVKFSEKRLFLENFFFEEFEKMIKFSEMSHTV